MYVVNLCRFMYVVNLCRFMYVVNLCRFMYVVNLCRFMYVVNLCRFSFAGSCFSGGGGKVVKDKLGHHWNQKQCTCMIEFDSVSNKVPLAEVKLISYSGGTGVEQGSGCPFVDSLFWRMQWKICWQYKRLINT